VIFLLTSKTFIKWINSSQAYQKTNQQVIPVAKCPNPKSRLNPEFHARRHCSCVINSGKLISRLAAGQAASSSSSDDVQVFFSHIDVTASGGKEQKFGARKCRAMSCVKTLSFCTQISLGHSLRRRVWLRIFDPCWQGGQLIF
jgi:hypothetical protein